MQMTEVRDKLQLLQEVLTEKYSIEKDVEEAPRRLSSQEELLARLKKEYLEKNSVYEECKERVGKLTVELEEAVKSREEGEKGMDNIATHREYEALDKQITEATAKEAEVRKELDAAGFPQAFISVSNELTEEIIETLVLQNAPIASWGVGTHMVTGGNESSFTGVYKLAARHDTKTGELVPAMKFSDNPAKNTNPGIKNVYRLYDSDGMARADILALEVDHVLCVIAENAGGLILAENNVISVNIYFQCVFLRDIQGASHLDRQNDTAELIDLTDNSS